MKRKIDLKQIKPSTIVRCVMEIFALLNQVFALVGVSANIPFISNIVYQVISVVLTVGVSIWAAWKNNDITTLATTAGKVFDALKDGSISEEEAKDMLYSADTIIAAENEEDEEELEEDAE